MRRLRTGLALTLASLWLVLPSHCLIETLPGMGFLTCCEHPDKAPHEDGDCEDDWCAVVESGHYRSEERAPLTATLLLQWALWTPTFQEPAFPPLRPCPITRTDTPPELAVAWQFAWRTASPPRAPSIPS